MSLLLCEVNIVIFYDFITQTSFSKVHKGKMYGSNDSILPNIIQLNVAWFMYRG